MSFTPSQQPDESIGRRYSKAFKYVFAMLYEGEDAMNADLASGNSGASSIVDEGRFVQLLLPQQLQLREPYATVVTVMQDGGKVIETKGHVLKLGTISGTTGFLPPNGPVLLQPTFGRLVPNVVDVDGQLGALSGYLTFQKLRYLFRLYGDQRRQGNLEVALYFFDYKNDDFWRIEPESFDMSRSNRRPMSYDYNVQFKCIELADSVVSKDQQIGPISGIPAMLPGNARVSTSNVGGVLAKVAGSASAASKSSILSSVARFADMVTSGINFLKYCDAVVQRAFQFTLNKLDGVVGFFENIHDSFFMLLDIVPTLLAQLNNSLAGLIRTVDEFAPENIAQELNAWWLECTTMADHMSVQVSYLLASQPQRDIKDTDVRFSQGRMKGGATTDLMQEPSGGGPDANPFIGTAGLSLVTDVDGIANTTQYVTIIINNGEDIYALARRVFGKIERFIDLVLLNKLEFPFIVADASSKPPNTLAWGESILVPSTKVTSSIIADGVDTASVPTSAGTVTTSSLPSQLIDDTATWLTDQWVGYSITATTGLDSQTLVCIANTDIQLTLNSNWTITITPSVTTYTIRYVQFNPRRPLTPEARAYGTDILVVFGNDGRADLALAAGRDLAPAQGLDNFIQAITLRARCPLSEHPFHKTYGLPAPVGRPYTDAVGALYTFFIRRSLLADPRVGKVRNIQLTLNGDKLSMSAEVQPIDSRISRPIDIQVGA